MKKFLCKAILIRYAEPHPDVPHSPDKASCDCCSSHSFSAYHVNGHEIQFVCNGCGHYNYSIVSSGGIQVIKY